MIGPFIVIWREDGEFLISQIDELENTDPNSIVSAAAASEGYSSEEILQMLENGYELIMCSTVPSLYVY